MTCQFLVKYDLFLLSILIKYCITYCQFLTKYDCWFLNLTYLLTYLSIMMHCVGVEPPECLRLTHNMVDKLLKISGDVEGLDCIVVDDMLDTGATARLALEVLHIHGARWAGSVSGLFGP